MDSQTVLRTSLRAKIPVNPLVPKHTKQSHLDEACFIMFHMHLPLLERKVADVVGAGAVAGLAMDAARSKALAMNSRRAAARERAAAVRSDAKAARLNKKGFQIMKLSLS